jgi:hypothetical protein
LEYFEKDITEPSFMLHEGSYPFPSSDQVIEGQVLEDILQEYLVEHVQIQLPPRKETDL